MLTIFRFTTFEIYPPYYEAIITTSAIISINVSMILFYDSDNNLIQVSIFLLFFIYFLIYSLIILLRL